MDAEKHLHEIFLSTPSARRATPGALMRPARTTISIHALREEGDAAHSAGSRRSTNFYPRPPRGGRPRRSTTTRTCSAFLSTPSARRATIVSEDARRQL